MKTYNKIIAIFFGLSSMYFLFMGVRFIVQGSNTTVFILMVLQSILFMLLSIMIWKENEK